MPIVVAAGLLLIAALLAASASAAGTLVSMPTLGLPTTSGRGGHAAAFQQYGIQPGPCSSNVSPTWCGA